MLDSYFAVVVTLTGSRAPLGEVGQAFKSELVLYLSVAIVKRRVAMSDVACPLNKQLYVSG